MDEYLLVSTPGNKLPVFVNHACHPTKGEKERLNIDKRVVQVFSLLSAPPWASNITGENPRQKKS